MKFSIKDEKLVKKSIEALENLESIVFETCDVTGFKKEQEASLLDSRVEVNSLKSLVLKHSHLGVRK